MVRRTSRVPGRGIHTQGPEARTRLSISTALRSMVFVLLGITMLAGCAGPRPSGDGTPDREERLRRFVESYHRTHRFDGAVLVAEGDRLLYEDGFGEADRWHGVPNTPATRFRVASITKVFTAVLVLQLAEEGALDLDRPVGRYVPRLRPEIADEVTVRQLLTHRGGLDVEYFAGEESPEHPYTVTELVDSLNVNTSLVASPGERFSYSNAGYVALAAVIESVSGTSYRSALRTRILDPLGLVDTGTEESATEIVDGLAQGYRLRLGVPIRADHQNMSSTRGNGGIYSTVRDLWYFDLALRSGELISEESLEILYGAGPGEIVASVATNVESDGYPDAAGRVAWARGANPGGFRTQWTRQVEGELTVILLANLDYSPRQEITQGLFEIVFGGDPPVAEPSAAQRTVERLEENGMESAADYLEEIRVADEAEAGGAINELYELGHHLIRAGNPVRALEVFRTIDRVYPDIPSIVVSFGYAHLAAGNPDAADSLARRTLELEPNQPDALEVLDALSIMTGGR